VSRATWKVQQGFWLTCCYPERGVEFRKECDLLRALGDTVTAHPELLLTVPSLVPTRSGDVVPTHSRFLWRLTRHLDGFHPPANDPATYDLMVNILVRLHQAFDFSSTEGADYPNILQRVCDRIRVLPHTLSGPSFEQHERDTLHEAANWLSLRLDRLAALPARVVHGDWTPSNVLIRRDGWVGILDFEECRLGPAVLDFANICSTLLMWSGLDNISERMGALVRSIGEKSAVPIGPEIVHIAMLAHWFGQYSEWRERELTPENNEVVRRLVGRIETVLKFVRAE
jgi:Ser/Thr protein kinase RdoA (MazF antagonist)